MYKMHSLYKIIYKKYVYNVRQKCLYFLILQNSLLVPIVKYFYKYLVQDTILSEISMIKIRIEITSGKSKTDFPRHTGRIQLDRRIVFHN